MSSSVNNKLCVHSHNTLRVCLHTTFAGKLSNVYAFAFESKLPKAEFSEVIFEIKFPVCRPIHAISVVFL